MREILKSNRGISILVARSVFAVLLASTLFVVGCDVGNSCLESCASDDECKSDYRCLSTIQYGQVCFPKECQTCWNNYPNASCEIVKDDVGGPDEVDIVCDFQSCNP